VFEVEQDLLADLTFLVQDGYTVTSQVAEDGPPQGKPVGVKLITTSTTNFTQMIATAKKIEARLKVQE